MFRFGLRTLISTESDMEIIGEATTGIETTRQVLKENPQIAILILTMLDDDSLFSAMRAGACGYLLNEETLRSIRAVADGDAIFSPSMAKRLSKYFSSTQVKSPESFPELTARERNILELIAQGLTNNAISERLVLSPKTVRNQVSTIFSKLQVASRGEAIAEARDSKRNSS